MKKILVVLFCFIMLFSFTSCNNTDVGKNESVKKIDMSLYEFSNNESARSVEYDRFFIDFFMYVSIGDYDAAMQFCDKSDDAVVDLSTLKSLNYVLNNNPKFQDLNQTYHSGNAVRFVCNDIFSIVISTSVVDNQPRVFFMSVIFNDSTEQVKYKSLNKQ